MEAGRGPTPELRPLAVGEVLDAAIKVYSRHFVPLLVATAVVVVPVQLLLVPVLVSAVPDAALVRPTFDPSPAAPILEPRDLAVAGAANGVAGLLGFLAATLAVAACFKAVSDAYLGGRPDPRASLRFAARRFLPVLWVSLLSTLIPALVLLAPAGLGVAIGVAAGPGAGLAVGFVAFLLAWPLAVWLFTSFAPATPALLTEGVGGVRALRRSTSLVRGRWWSTFAALLLGILLATLLQFVIGGLLVGLLFTELGDNTFLSVLVSQIATAIATVVATPFQAAVVALIYFDLRVRKEGFDLELQAERLGLGPTGQPTPDEPMRRR